MIGHDKGVTLMHFSGLSVWLISSKPWLIYTVVWLVVQSKQMLLYVMLKTNIYFSMAFVVG
jgi:hypothetical protein